MKVHAPTSVVLYRARLIFVLTALIPTVLITVLGVLFVAMGGSKSMAVVGGILMLAFCATALAGWALGTIFVTRGASLAALQNEFLSSVSHELRTPLTSIRLFIDTLREGRVADPVAEQRCFSIINQELVRLDGLVGRLIELSKIESRRDVFERRPVTVSDIVEDALATLKTVDLTTDIDVDVKVDRSLVVRGDRAALVQAVGNLLSNAWKYTRPGQRQIQVTATADVKHVYISVTDNGFGISAEEQRVIFDKFQRGAAALEHRSPGSGLGLAIVRAIVTAHAGRIDVNSQIDRGATFRITLPRGVPEAA
ncbi:MAG TPA: ATP-binding protein [Polyangia bacterium]|nr:ATP-binding protein [Polyangia bacterium]